MSRAADPAATVRPGRLRREAVPAYVWLFLAGLAANMFAGNWSYLGFPIGIDRGLILLALVLLVLDPTFRPPQLRAVHVVMVVCVAWTAVSWLNTGSLRDTKKMYALSDRVVVPLLMFVVGSLVFNSQWRRILLLRMLALVGIYLGITAVGEISQVTDLVWPHFILDRSLGIQFGRARGPFLESEAMGMSCALTFFTSGLLMWRSRGWWRGTASLAMALSLVGVLLCMTRTAWISTVVASLLIGLLVPRLRRWTPVVFAGAIGLAAVVLTALPSLAASLDDRLTTKRSVYDRVTTNDAAVRIVDAHPALGIGWGRFVEVSPIWIRQGDTIPLTTVDIEIHNVFLSRAAETGVIGAALWIACMLAGPAYVLTRRAATPELQGWRLLTLAAVLVWLLPSLLSPNNYPLPNNLVWLIGGIASQSQLLWRPVRVWPPTARSAAEPISQ